MNFLRVVFHLILFVLHCVPNLKLTYMEETLMTEPVATDLLQLPGTDSIGRLAYLPIKMTDELIVQTEELSGGQDKEFTCSENKTTYGHPSYIGIYSDPINNSPIKSAETFTTYEEVKKRFSVKSTVKRNYGVMSASVSSEYVKSTDHIDEYMSSVQTTTIPYFENQLLIDKIPQEDLIKLKNKIKNAIPSDDLNVNDDYSIKKYLDYFRNTGSHFISKVQVGGQSYLAMEVSKSSTITSEELTVAMSVSYKAVNSASLDTEVKNSLEEVQTAQGYSFKVYGQGGALTELAMISDVDEGNIDHYQNWLNSIDSDPGVIWREYKGNWELFTETDEKTIAQKLEKAYTELCNKFYLEDISYPLYGKEEKTQSQLNITIGDGKQLESTILFTPIWNGGVGAAPSVFNRSYDGFSDYSGSHAKNFFVNWLTLSGKSPMTILNEKVSYIDSGYTIKSEKSLTINFKREFIEPPIVILTSEYGTNLGQVTLNRDNVTTKSFKMYDGLYSLNLVINWIAIGKLKNPVGQNLKMAFGRTKKNVAEINVAFPGGLFTRTPVVLATSERTDQVSSTSRVIKRSKDSATFGGADKYETSYINWLAIETNEDS